MKAGGGDDADMAVPLTPADNRDRSEVFQSTVQAQGQAAPNAFRPVPQQPRFEAAPGSDVNN